jgi:hypothetical protein
MTRKEQKEKVYALHHSLVFRSSMLTAIFLVLVSVIPVFIPVLASVPWMVWGIPGIVGLWFANHRLIKWGNRQAGF